ncbi:hypothetical protein [Meridianimarinicoccus roseus]|nr:hypothetical protein [Meridianimarinicoccus roseus]
MCATKPVLGMKVLSPSPGLFETHQLVSEHRNGQDIAYVLLSEPDSPRFLAHLHDGFEWRDHFHAGLDQVVRIREIRASLALIDMYADCKFRYTRDGLRQSPCQQKRRLFFSGIRTHSAHLGAVRLQPEPFPTPGARFAFFT